jgi:hypothetical protein
MNAQIKNALMTTGIVLASIFVLRKVAFTKNIVDNALNG